MKKDSTIKIIGVSALAIIALWLLRLILFPTGNGISVSYRVPMHMGNGYVYGNGLNSFGGSGALLLAFLIKVLLIVFVIALLLGFLMFIKNHVFTQEDILMIKNSFAGKPDRSSKVCLECGKNLNEDWKICPHCGKEIDKL